jgi:predicted PurR-regulated permease PerM
MRLAPVSSQTFLLLSLALVIYLFYQILRPFLFALILAMTLVSLFYPKYVVLRGLVRGRAALASVMMCSIITILIVIPLVLLFFFLASELNDAYAVFMDNEDHILQLMDKPYPAVLDPLVARMAALLGQDGFNFREMLTSRLEDLARFLISRSSTILGSVGWLLLNFVVMVFSMFFLFRDGHLLLARLRKLLPLTGNYLDVLVLKLQNMVRATFFGIFVTGLCQGLLAGVIFALLGIEKPVFWGAAVACVSIVPFFGTGVIWVPMSIYLMLSGSLGKGIVLFLLGAFAIALVDNLVRPMVIEGRSEDMHVLLLFFAFAGGLLFFGPPGVILGPLVTALLMALLEIYRLETGTPPRYSSSRVDAGPT